MMIFLKLKEYPKYDRITDYDDFNNSNVNYKFYNIFNNGIKFVEIELITNFQLDRGYNLGYKQTEIVNKMINNFKINKNK